MENVTQMLRKKFENKTLSEYDITDLKKLYQIELSLF